MKAKQYLLSFFIALIITLFVRTFIFEIYFQNFKTQNYTDSFVIVNKLKYGSRLPITPISFPFFDHHFPYTNLRTYLDIRIPYVRFSGNSPISKENNILYNELENTNLAIDRRNLKLAKCIAVPGDNLLFTKRKLTINNQTEIVFWSEKFRFWIKNNDSLIKNKYNLPEENLANFIGTFELSKNDFLFDELLKDTSTFSFQVFDENEMDIFLVKKQIFNPISLIVPARNLEVKITSSNFRVLIPLLVEHENVTVEMKAHKLYINGNETKTYKFTQDYFLILEVMKGRLQFNLIPESHIIGVVN